MVREEVYLNSFKSFFHDILQFLIYEKTWYKIDAYPAYIGETMHSIYWVKKSISRI